MDPCNDFEVAIEMRIHGALPRDQEEALAAHTRTCAACRAFEDIAKKTESLMSQRAQQHAETMDWEALFSRTKIFIDRSARSRLAAGAVVLVAMTSMMLLMGQHLERSAWHAMIVGFAIFVAIWVKSRIQIADAARHRDDVGELLFLYRSEIEKRLRATRWVAVVPVLVPIFYWTDRERLVSPEAWAGFLGMVFVMLGATAYVALVRRPRLRRELDVLTAEIKK